MSYSSLHLDPGESVILEVRKHWIIFAIHAAGLFFVSLLPLIVWAAVKILIPGGITINLPGNEYALFLFLYVLWLLTLWILFFVEWTKYYLDVWYVTEKRIIAIDQRAIFNREVSNLRFDKIQDITVDVHGFIPTLLGFGNIKVQTASEDSAEFFLSTVRHPEHIRQVIFAQQNKIGDKAIGGV